MKTMYPLLLAVSAVLSTVACSAPVEVDDVSAEPVDDAEQALPSWLKPKPPAGLNGKSPECLWNKDHINALRQLAQGPLVDANGELPDVKAMFDSDKCYMEVMDNLIGCALEEGKDLPDKHNNVFHGWWGLSVGWMTNSLDSGDARWLTGCMTQRLNGMEQEVPILLEGRATPINYSAFWQAYFPFDESITYGNLFGGSIDTVPPVNVCWSPGLGQFCFETGCNPMDYLNKRICDTSDECNLVIMGPCAERCYTDPSTEYPICGDANNMFDDHTVRVKLEVPNQLPN